MWDDLAPVIDGAMIDLKCLDPEIHVEMTGHPNDKVLASIEHLHRLGLLYEVRLLLMAGVNDGPDLLQRTPRWLADIDPTIRLKLIGFRAHGARPHEPALVEPTRDAVLHAADLLQNVRAVQHLRHLTGTNERRWRRACARRRICAELPLANTRVSHMLSHLWDNTDQHATTWPERKLWSDASQWTHRTRTDGLERFLNVCRRFDPCQGRHVIGVNMRWADTSRPQQFAGYRSAECPRGQRDYRVPATLKAKGEQFVADGMRP